MSAPLSRRRLLAPSAAGGLEGILTARRAPAFAQGTRLHLLQWSHFIPAADTLFDAQAREFASRRVPRCAWSASTRTTCRRGRPRPSRAGRGRTLASARQVGYAGPPGRRATEALSKYIIVDMFAKAIQGMKPEDAVAWAAGELEKIYDA
jgi:hypothetical protein